METVLIVALIAAAGVILLLAVSRKNANKRATAAEERAAASAEAADQASLSASQPREQDARAIEALKENLAAEVAARNELQAENERLSNRNEALANDCDQLKQSFIDTAKNMASKATYTTSEKTNKVRWTVQDEDGKKLAADPVAAGQPTEEEARQRFKTLCKHLLS